MRQIAGHRCVKRSYKMALCDQVEKWSTRVVRNPRVNIILPLLIAIIFSYKTLSLFLTPSQLMSYIAGNAYVSKVELLEADKEAVNGVARYQLSMAQIWVKSLTEAGNILTKRALLESLAFQNKILKGISSSTVVSSPFQLWNNSLNVLHRDQFPLQTINTNFKLLPRYSFLGIWKINGFVSSAAGIVISTLVKEREHYEVTNLLQKNIQYLNSISNVTHFYVLPPEEVQRTCVNDVTGTLRFYMMKLNDKFNYLLLLSNIFLIIYLIVSMRRLKNSLKSVIGVAIAMVTQIMFAIACSVTVTDLLFKSSSDHVPFRLFCWPIILILMNEQLRLIESVSASTTLGGLANCKVTNGSADAKVTVRDGMVDYKNCEFNKNFITCLSDSHYRSTKWLLVFSLVVFFIIPFSRKVTHFLLFALWLGHFLECTFFSAVLSLDYRRRDQNSILNGNSEDDIFLDDNKAPISSKVRKFHTILASTKLTVIISLACLSFWNQKFSLVRSSSSLVFKLINHEWNRAIIFKKRAPTAAFDQRVIFDTIFTSSTSDDKVLVDLVIQSPVIVLQSENKTAVEDVVKNQIDALSQSISFTSSYKIDFYYALQFVTFVILVLSCTLLLLQKLMEKFDSGISLNPFSNPGLDQVMTNAKAAKDGEAFFPSQNSPQHEESSSVADNFHVKELYRGGHSLDIMRIATSKAPFVVSVGLDHKVFVWSPLLNPVPNPTSIPLQRKFWPLSKVTLSNDGRYIAFFGKNGNITTWSRRHMRFIWELKLRKQDEDKSSHVHTLEALFRKVSVPAMRKRRLQSLAKKADVSGRRTSVASSEFVSMVTDGLDATYEKTGHMSNDSEEEHELVFVTSSGLIYSIRGDGGIKVDDLTPSEHALKSCKLLSSPRVNDRLVICDQIGDLYISTVVNNKWRTRKLNVNYDRILKPPPNSCEMREENESKADPKDPSSVSLATDYTVELVSFVGLIVRVIGRNADLIDAQTGTVIRRFLIDYFKPNSLRVFHDNPTHCRFCGSASVASFSIAYTDRDCNRVIMHTFKLESKTKTSICLRVERDIREIRCLGIESAIATVHYFYDVEDWCVTDNNMLIGMRRIPEDIVSTKTGSTSISRGLMDDRSTAVSKRKTTDKSGTDSDAHLIHSIWEGWTMSASGKVSLHKIPAGFNGLLVDRLGPLTKFGAKAVLVGFANIMDMFYIGHEDLVFNTEKDDANKEETGLRYVNKRRDRLSHKKLPLNYSNL